MALAIGGLVLGIGLALALFLVAVPQLEEAGQVDAQFGDDVFTVGRADEDLAGEIADRGPLLIADAAGGDRDVYVQHIGDDPEKGWLVFAARPVDVGRDCTLVWDAEAEELFFDDTDCPDDRFPADGEGLKQYPVTIDEDGNMSVDLNFETRPSTTTEPPPEKTTTTIPVSGKPD